MFKASRVQRLFLFNLANLIMIAIWLTGFATVHWFMYVIPGAMYFAAATGFCPGLGISRWLLDRLGLADKPA